jgi:hypothetical protein
MWIFGLQLGIPSGNLGLETPKIRQFFGVRQTRLPQTGRNSNVVYFCHGGMASSSASD